MEEALKSIREQTKYLTVTTLVLTLVILTSVNPIVESKQIYLRKLKTIAEKLNKAANGCLKEESKIKKLIKGDRFRGIASSNLEYPIIKKNVSIEDLQNYNKFFSNPLVWHIPQYSVESTFNRAPKDYAEDHIEYEVATIDPIENLDNKDYIRKSILQYLSTSKHNDRNRDTIETKIYFQGVSRSKEEKELRRPFNEPFNTQMLISPDTSIVSECDSNWNTMLAELGSLLKEYESNESLQKVDATRPINVIVAEYEKVKEDKIEVIGIKMGFPSLLIFTPILFLILLLFLLVQVSNLYQSIYFVQKSRHESKHDLYYDVILFPSIMINKDAYSILARFIVLFVLPQASLVIIILKLSELYTLEWYYYLYYVLACIIYILISLKILNECNRTIKEVDSQLG